MRGLVHEQSGEMQGLRNVLFLKLWEFCEALPVGIACQHDKQILDADAQAANARFARHPVCFHGDAVERFGIVDDALLCAFSLLPVWRGDELGFFGEGYEEAAGGFDGGEALCGEGVLAAIVEDEIGAAVAGAVVLDAAIDAAVDFGGGDGFPIADDEVPLDGGEAERTGDAEDSGAAGAVRGAEKGDGTAEGVFEDFVAGFELGADAGFGVAGEAGMGHGVVAEGVAGGGDGAGESGLGADVAADEEEGGADVVAGEEIEEVRGDGGVGAVVEGEGELGGKGWGDEGGAGKLGAGRKGGIGGEAGGGCHGGRDGEGGELEGGERHVRLSV